MQFSKKIQKLSFSVYEPGEINTLPIYVILWESK